MKISIEEVEKALRNKQVPAATIVAVVNELEQVAEDKKADKDPKQKNKNQHVIVALDSNGQIKTTMVGLVVQVEDGVSPTVVQNRVAAAARAYNNNTRKGRSHPVTKFAEALEVLPRKFLKAEKVLVKTKNPVEIVVSDNNL